MDGEAIGSCRRVIRCKLLSIHHVHQASDPASGLKLWSNAGGTPTKEGLAKQKSWFSWGSGKKKQPAEVHFSFGGATLLALVILWLTKRGVVCHECTSPGAWTLLALEKRCIASGCCSPDRSTAQISKQTGSKGARPLMTMTAAQKHGPRTLSNSS